MSPARSLKLDRGLSNHVFGSWRLDPDAHVTLGRHALPGRVQPVSATGEGFLQTKTVVQHQHLHEQLGRHYVFLQQAQEPPALHRIEYKDEASGIATHRLTGAFAIPEFAVEVAVVLARTPKTQHQRRDALHGAPRSPCSSRPSHLHHKNAAYIHCAG